MKRYQGVGARLQPIYWARGCLLLAFSFYGGYLVRKRVCVFVDGENLRHSICDLFERFNKSDYLPHKAKWKDFFDFLVKKVHDDGERIRTYWYVVQHIDFFPYKFPDAEKKTDMLYKILSKHDPFKNILDDLEAEDRKDKMKELTEALKKKEAQMTTRFKGWDKIQNEIALEHDAVEFRRAGAIRYDLFTNCFGTEKAVDVKFATDLITLTEIYDTAIIVSGDQDYVPAVQYVKDRGKRVVNVTFKTRNGRMLPGGARRLNEITDWSFAISYEECKEFLNITD